MRSVLEGQRLEQEIRRMDLELGVANGTYVHDVGPEITRCEQVIAAIDGQIAALPDSNPSPEDLIEEAAQQRATAILIEQRAQEIVAETLAPKPDKRSKA